MAFFSTLATLAAVAAAGTGIAASAGAFTPKPKTPESVKMPEIPKAVTEPASEVIAKSEQKATEAIRQKQVAARRSRSVYSSPLGLAGEATTVRKTLLGQ